MLVEIWWLQRRGSWVCWRWSHQHVWKISNTFEKGRLELQWSRTASTMAWSNWLCQQKFKCNKRQLQGNLVTYLWFIPCQDWFQGYSFDCWNLFLFAMQHGCFRMCLFSNETFKNQFEKHYRRISFGEPHENWRERSLNWEIWCQAICFSLGTRQDS